MKNKALQYLPFRLAAIVCLVFSFVASALPVKAQTASRFGQGTANAEWTTCTSNPCPQGVTHLVEWIGYGDALFLNNTGLVTGITIRLNNADAFDVSISNLSLYIQPMYGAAILFGTVNTVVLNGNGWTDVSFSRPNSSITVDSLQNSAINLFSPTNLPTCTVTDAFGTITATTCHLTVGGTSYDSFAGDTTFHVANSGDAYIWFDVNGFVAYAPSLCEVGTGSALGDLLCKLFVPSRDSWFNTTWSLLKGTLEQKAPFAYWFGIKAKLEDLDVQNGATTLTLDASISETIGNKNVNVPLVFPIMPASGKWRETYDTYFRPLEIVALYLGFIGWIFYRIRDVNDNV